jgi:hypothetical protein
MNLVAWLAGSFDASLGAAGIGFKPTQSLFGVDE